MLLIDNNRYIRTIRSLQNFPYMGLAKLNCLLKSWEIEAILFFACSAFLGESAGYLHAELRVNVLGTRHFADHFFAADADQAQRP